MDEDSGLDKLFFELASESRLAILRLLQKEKLKMQEIARRLNVTATEAFRQLERLTTAALVERQPDGSFEVSEYGKLVLQVSSSLDFISKNKAYFSTHNVMLLPAQFVNRLGELSGAQLSLDTIANLNKSEQAYVNAKVFGCGIAEGTIPEHMIPKMNQKMLEGLKFKFLIPMNRMPETDRSIETPNVEGRGIDQLPLILVLTEKFGGVCFLQADGKVDYAGFMGDDPTFLKWVTDVFNYYWEQAGYRKD
ncbi:MAG: helix-turn-helix transcriptional regulator [Candidatus Bathyarchaeia archaeon]|jgi:predicted transcriptional regulator